MSAPSDPLSANVLLATHEVHPIRPGATHPTQIGVAHTDHVAATQPPAAPYLRFPVDPYSAVGEDRLDVPANLNEIGKLEELTQPDHLGRDHNFAHVAIISRIDG